MAQVEKGAKEILPVPEMAFLRVEYQERDFWLPPVPGCPAHLEKATELS